ncbi:hypothetical protein RhiirA4_469254 [Rhizophagus irregularis]|uniref:Uncharacterized protein n=1 Tax=Rhizophagus irregularis TaxID=588596 RepID=A0A2I1GZ68_9GLOM|nr:hypothetical protein RhiirA4_469254 [Rhizophagus irregularis]
MSKHRKTFKSSSNDESIQNQKARNVYLSKLLEKNTKEEFETEIENNKSFLKIEYTNKNEDEIDESDVISEVELLKLGELSFDQIKEETIKTLVSQLVIVYNEVLQ